MKHEHKEVGRWAAVVFQAGLERFLYGGELGVPGKQRVAYEVIQCRRVAAVLAVVNLER